MAWRFGGEGGRHNTREGPLSLLPTRYLCVATQDVRAKIIALRPCCRADVPPARLWRDARHSWHRKGSPAAGVKRLDVPHFRPER